MQIVWSATGYHVMFHSHIQLSVKQFRVPFSDVITVSLLRLSLKIAQGRSARVKQVQIATASVWEYVSVCVWCVWYSTHPPIPERFTRDHTSKPTPAKYPGESESVVINTRPAWTHSGSQEAPLLHRLCTWGKVLCLYSKEVSAQETRCNADGFQFNFRWILATIQGD